MCVCSISIVDAFEHGRDLFGVHHASWNLDRHEGGYSNERYHEDYLDVRHFSIPRRLEHLSKKSRYENSSCNTNGNSRTKRANHDAGGLIVEDAIVLSLGQAHGT